ncbi:MAG: hypothetical protein CSA97_04295 [Bacteroidetes bacterium]|nr:MAG: hypothetical protein CSA97_04295 [Bacteroidota bacterium]
MRYARKLVPFLLVFVALATACRKDEYPSNVESVNIEEYTAPSEDKAGTPPPVGMYVLNNGGKGNYESTLDYVDFAAGGVYHHNFFAEKNNIPSLGDNGLTMKIAQKKLFIVLNGSHKVMVICADVEDEENFGKLLGEVGVNQPSDIAIVGDYAYVTSMIRPKTAEGRKPLGEVVRFDITQFVKGGEKRIEQGDIPRADRVAVGCQPVSIVQGSAMNADDGYTKYMDYLFVANSGSLNAPEFDNTVSFISIADGEFAQKGMATLERKQPLCVLGAYDYLMVVTKGDSEFGDDLQLQKYAVDIDKVELKPVVKESGELLPPKKDVAKAVFDGGTLFMLKGHLSGAGAISQPSFRTTVPKASDKEGYSKTDVVVGSREYLSTIEALTALAIAPNYDRVVLDARNYTSSGRILYFNVDGKHLWSARAGIIPVAVAFQTK